MEKKLNSLEDLARIQFESLEPDPEPIAIKGPTFIKQNLEAHFSNKGRAGKTVTIIKGFNGEAVALKNLAKILKNSIGVGGTVKNREIIIQGNYRDSLIVLLKKMGHLVKRVGG
tara:strand:- start:810 stop:1151 length:342 start_codon:yes stop_codon:yes gene_type:complete